MNPYEVRLLICISLFAIIMFVVMVKKQGVTHMNNFERWKQDLTIEEASKLINDTRFYCGRCPARKQCTQQPLSCADTFKEWGERND